MPLVDDWMTPAAWAASLGMSKQAGHKALHRCGIPRREDGKVSKAVADALYRSRTRARAKAAPTAADRDAPPAAPGAEPVDYTHWRNRRERAQALHAERELQAQAATLCRVEDVRRIMGRHLAAAREIAMNTAGRVGPLVAAESDPGRCIALLMEQMRAMLHQLAAIPDALKDTGGEA